MRNHPTAERLIEVAGEIFAVQGQGATVREICKTAECSVAAISYHFGDKQQLYARCVEAACQRKQQLFPFPDVDDERPPAEVLGEFLRAVTARMCSRANLPWQNTLMLREVLSPTEGVSESLQAFFRADFEKLAKLMSRLLGTELDEQSLRDSLLTQVLARCMFLRVGKSIRGLVGLDLPENEDPEQYADTICESLLMQINTLRSRRELPPHCRPLDRRTLPEGNSQQVAEPIEGKGA